MFLKFRSNRRGVKNRRVVKKDRPKKDRTKLKSLAYPLSELCWWGRAPETGLRYPGTSESGNRRSWFEYQSKDLELIQLSAEAIQKKWLQKGRYLPFDYKSKTTTVDTPLVTQCRVLECPRDFYNDPLVKPSNINFIIFMTAFHPYKKYWWWTSKTHIILQ